MVLGASPFVTSFATLESFATWWSASPFLYGMSLVSSVVIYDWVFGTIDPVKLLFLGDVMLLITELCSAAYILVKTTDYITQLTYGWAA
jgi:hypothetical protein